MSVRVWHRWVASNRQRHTHTLPSPHHLTIDIYMFYFHFLLFLCDRQVRWKWRIPCLTTPLYNTRGSETFRPTQSIITHTQASSYSETSQPDLRKLDEACEKKTRNKEWKMKYLTAKASFLRTITWPISYGVYNCHTCHISYSVSCLARTQPFSVKRTVSHLFSHPLGFCRLSSKFVSTSRQS